jgi:hypothetical protein
VPFKQEDMIYWCLLHEYTKTRESSSYALTFSGRLDPEEKINNLGLLNARDHSLLPELAVDKRLGNVCLTSILKPE